MFITSTKQRSWLTRVVLTLLVAIIIYWFISRPTPHVRTRVPSTWAAANGDTTTANTHGCECPVLGVNQDIVGAFMRRCSAKPATTIVTERAPSIDQSTLLPSQYHWVPGKPEKHKKKAAVIVESRAVDRLVRVILQFMAVLDDDWEFQVYHSPRNERMLRDSASLQWAMARGRLKLYPMGREVFDVPWYNVLFMNNQSFWEHIGSEHILIFQVDAVPCAASPTTINDYLHFDYIGAPWSIGYYGEFGGNGGLSLRTRSGMLACSGPGMGNGQNEDGWFTQCLLQLGKNVANKTNALQFSVETVYSPTPWGVHNAWAYMTQVEVTILQAYCPEMEDAIWFHNQEK